MRNALYNVFCAVCAVFYLVTSSCVGIHSCRAEGTRTVVFLLSHDNDEDGLHHDADGHRHHCGCCSTEIVELVSAQNSGDEHGHISVPISDIFLHATATNLSRTSSTCPSESDFPEKFRPPLPPRHFRILLI